MATYKVLQDIEAEDKILGPLTLKQFIFGIISVALIFIQFKIITTEALGPIRVILVLAFMPFLLVFGFLAIPIGRDQPNDVWLLARLRYLLKPHKRIWNQDGAKELVTITAPKHEEKQLTNNLSQDEVKSRLQALASTLDSRGWAIKNIDATTYRQTNPAGQGTSDRLIGVESFSQPINPDANAQDMLDLDANPALQQLDSMVQASSVTHRQQLLQSLQTPQNSAAPSDYWFLQGSATSQQGQVVVPDPSVDFVSPRSATPAITSYHAVQNQPKYTQPQVSKTETTARNPAIIELAHNDDLNVATIARQAHRLDESNGEVVVSLH